VTGAVAFSEPAPGQPPVWCEDDESKCVKGPKELMCYHQAGRNDIFVNGYQRNGELEALGYNMTIGFHNGAQNDIVEAVVERVSASIPPKVYECHKFLAQDAT